MLRHWWPAGHGWQLDGGHAAFMLAEEVTCILLPPGLSYTDGALVACGFGTTYEALTRMSVSGRDQVLVSRCTFVAERDPQYLQLASSRICSIVPPL